MCTGKIGALSQLGAEKIMFPSKPSWQTDGQTDDIIVSLLWFLISDS